MEQHFIHGIYGICLEMAVSYAKKLAGLQLQASYLAGRLRLSIVRLASRDCVLVSLSGSGASLVEMDTRAWVRRNVKW